MSAKLLKTVLCTVMLLLIDGMDHIGHPAESENMLATRQAPGIPGISGEDPFPLGCVSCHISMPDKDARISTLMKRLAEQVAPGLLEKAQAAMLPGTALQGKHPPMADKLDTIPTTCLACHGSPSQGAPLFSRMIHLIHLTGGKGNHYITLFQGECAYCHKLDTRSGAWSIPSGRENP